MADSNDPQRKERTSIGMVRLAHREGWKSADGGTIDYFSDELFVTRGPGVETDGETTANTSEEARPLKERASIGMVRLPPREVGKGNGIGEFDNLYDELFKAPADPSGGKKAAVLPVDHDPRQPGEAAAPAGARNGVGEIDYLYDELLKVPGGAAEEDYTGGEWPLQSLTLEYLDGTKTTVANAVLFRPAGDALTIAASETTEESVVRLAELACIRLTAKPKGISRGGGAVVVETVDVGERHRYTISVPAKQYSEYCLYGYATDKRTFAVEFFFFPCRNIRHRCQSRLLGEIMVSLEMLGAAEVRRAVEEQRLGRRRLGEIIVELAHLSPPLAERAIQRAYRRNTGLRVGEILVKARLVDENMVREALKVQKHLRRRIGEMLLDKGLVNEEQISRALADKFSIPYVELMQEKFNRKALAALPKEMAIKLGVLPINFDRTHLVVAIIFPEVPAIKDMVRHHTQRQDIKMVLTRPSHLRAAIKKFYP